MSAPSPDIQKTGGEHTYQQTSDTSEHSLLKHPHVCSCCEKDSTPLKTDHSTHCHSHPKITHTHNVINLTHGNPTNHMHPTTQSVHVHVHASPKSGSATKLPSTGCNCHLEEITGENGQEIRESGGGGQETKHQDTDDRIEISPLPPALPPRPPPRTRFEGQGTLMSSSRGHFSEGSLKQMRSTNQRVKFFRKKFNH